MIELRTLGSLDLRAPEMPSAQGVLRQPKRCAVLAYLAVAAPTSYVRRDTLLALFWPEADQARGRNALRQTVYQLRQFLGADAIRNRGDEELSIDPAIVVCDVTRFEKLLAEGRADAALELYRGDFLTGFHVPDAAPELEEWMQSEARRLRALATTAAWSLAQAQAGNASSAAHWSRRVLALDPWNEARLTEVMQLLARTGDRAAALQVYQEYARRVEAEFDMAPSAAMQKLADDLRRESLIMPSAPAVERVAVAAHPADEAGRTPSPRASSDWLHRTRIIGPGVLVVAAIALGAALSRRDRPAATEPQPVIAIGRIVDTSNGDSTAPSSVAADLLSTSLARLQGVQVIPLARVTDVQAQLRAAGRAATSTLAAAQQLGAGYLIEGSLHSAPNGGLQIDLQMLDARTGSVARVQRASGSDLFSAVDQATNAIALAFDVSTPGEPITQVTTRSIVAYRLYDQGLQAYYADDMPAAHRLFVAALAEDSSFAMAAYYAGISAPKVPERNSLLHRAVSLADRATDRERLLIQEGVAMVGMSASATALADTMAVRYPLDPDAQFVYGHVLLRRGDFLAAARQYRRVIEMDSLSLRGSARCVACDAYGHLIWSFLYADSAAAAERVAREFAAVRPQVIAHNALHIALARQDRFADARRAIQGADSIAPGTVELAYLAITVALRAGDFADADARLRTMLRDGNREARERAGWYLVLSLRMQGRFKEALRLPERLINPVNRPLVQFESGKPQAAAQGFEALVGYMDTISLPGARVRHRAFMLTHVATSLAAAGDTSRLQQIADSVEQFGQLSAFGRDPKLHHYIRGLLWNMRQQPARAAIEFRNSIWSWSEGFTRANYELARALMTLNRPAEAIYPLQAALRGDVESSNLYITRTELHELLAQAFDRLDQPDSAAVHYRHVVAAWRNCDPILQPRLRAAQARSQALP